MACWCIQAADGPQCCVLDRAGPDVRRQPGHGGEADQGIPPSRWWRGPYHHDDPAGIGNARRGDEELQPGGARGTASTARAGAARSMMMRAGRLELEVLRRGAGQPLLLLHDVNPIDPRAHFVDLLAKHGEVIAPSHPGFGQSARPDDFDTIYDLINLYHDVLAAIPAPGVTVIGFGFGGWIAAELAVAGAHKLARLILVDPVGI